MRCIINKAYLCSEQALDLVLWLNFPLFYLWQKDVGEWTLKKREKEGQTDRQSHRGHMCKYEAEGTTQIPISGGKNNAIVLTDVQWWGNCLTRDNDTDISCTRTHARALSEAGRSRWAGWSEHAASSWFHGDIDTNFKPTPLSLVPIFGQSPPPAPTLPSIKSVTPQTK